MMGGTGGSLRVLGTPLGHPEMACRERPGVLK